MRLVLDTNVVVAGLLWKGHSRHLLALAANANLIVSGDKHLHSLGGAYQGIRIVTPAEAIHAVGAK